MKVSLSLDKYISQEVLKLISCFNVCYHKPMKIRKKNMFRDVNGVVKLQTRYIAEQPNGTIYDIHDLLFSQNTNSLVLMQLLLSLSQCGCCSRHSKGIISGKHFHYIGKDMPKQSSNNYTCDCPCRHYLRNHFKLRYWLSKIPE